MTETKKSVKEEDVKSILPKGKEEFKAEELKEEDLAVVNPECNDADHISRAKVLDVIKTTFAKYETKVVLAMSEVRDIINTIIKAVKE